MGQAYVEDRAQLTLDACRCEAGSLREGKVRGMYDWLKFIHIVAAMVWVGGAVWVGFFGRRVAASKDPARARAFASDMVIGSRIIMGSSIVVLLAGVWMVIDNDIWDWENTFIVLGIIMIVIAGVAGGTFFGPQTEKAVEDFDAGRIPQAIGRMQKIGQASQGMLVLLLIVVFSMVAKWGV